MRYLVLFILVIVLVMIISADGKKSKKGKSESKDKSRSHSDDKSKEKHGKHHNKDKSKSGGKSKGKSVEKSKHSKSKSKSHSDENSKEKSLFDLHGSRRSKEKKKDKSKSRDKSEEKIIHLKTKSAEKKPKPEKSQEKKPHKNSHSKSKSKSKSGSGSKEKQVTNIKKSDKSEKKETKPVPDPKKLIMPEKTDKSDSEDEKITKAVVCERQKQTLKCPTGQVLRIISAMYGRLDRTNCPKGNIRTTSCSASRSKSMATLRGSCDGRVSCELYASNGVFGDPCVGTKKYLEVTYRCEVDTRNKKSSITNRLYTFNLPNRYNYLMLTKYGITAEGRSCFQFDVRTCHDAHVGLMRSDKMEKNIYEIVIGGWSNRISVIRNQMQGPIRARFNGGLLNCKDYRQFWVSWTLGVIRFGRGNKCNDQTLMTWKDPKPYPVKYIGISNGFGASGSWRIWGGTTQKQTSPPKPKTETAVDTKDKKSSTTGRLYTFSLPNRYNYLMLTKYGITAEGRSCFQFDVRACHDAHVGLMRSDKMEKNIYEIVIGGWSNRISVIRNQMQGSIRARFNGGLLSCKDNRPFWVSWTLGVIRFGRGNKCNDQTLMTWKDPKPYPVKYIGISNGFGASGSWRIRGGTAQKETPPQKPVPLVMPKTETSGTVYTFNLPSQYKYTMLTKYGITAEERTCFQFEVQTCRDAHVGLMSSDKQEKNMYEIVIGGWSNRMSIIRNEMQGPYRARFSGGLLSCVQYRQFWVSWALGVIRVGRGNKCNDQTLMAWKDPKPYSVKYIGISNGIGATGSWRIRRDTTQKPTPEKKSEPIPVPKTEEKEISASYLGCYEDKPARILDKSQMDNYKLTIQMCIKYCEGKRKQYAGVEYKKQCFCGSKLKNFSKRPEKECNNACAGDSTQKCGGTWRINVYRLNCGGRSCHQNGHCRRGRCVCNRGFHGDGYNSCEKSCLCMASGDPHYKTFDGQMIHFMGTCKYTLSKSKAGNDTCAFNVEVKNERRGRNKRVAYTRFVDVELYGKKIRLQQEGKVLINGRRKYLPFETRKKNLKVFQSGRYVQIWSDCGVLVNFDGNHAVSVTVPGRYSKRMSGLCGNCDGTRNDFVTKGGEDVSSNKQRYSMIGDSYSVMDDSTMEENKCVTLDSPVECDAKTSNLINSDSYCGELQKENGKFAECIAEFSEIAKEFFDSCKFDVCSYEGEKELMEETKCKSLEAFAEQCAENGINVKWRSKDFCPITCKLSNMEYLAEGPGCPETCNNPDPSANCTIEPREGCYCKEGFVLSDGGCVRQSECGCTDEEGDYYPIGAKKGSEDCGTEYECKRDDKGARFVKVSKGRKCNRKAKCQLDENGEKTCVCKKGFYGDGYKTCKKLCGKKFRCHKDAACRKGRCVCKKNFFGDGQNSCESMCSCSASGDPHYRTFDGQMIHFMGICKYTLTKSTTKSDPCGFEVEIKNERRGLNRRVSYTKMVLVKVYGKTVKLAKDRKVYVDGKRKYLPVEGNNGDLSIFLSGKYVRLVTACNLVISWDGKHVVRVEVPRKYSGKLSGLCGDCNGKKDDLKTRDGKDVSTELNKFALIGTSYEVHGPSGEPSHVCKTEEDDVKCTPDMLKIAKTKGYCGFMDYKQRASSPFKACLGQMPNLASQMYKSCVFDVCSYFNDVSERKDVACRAFEGLEAACEKAGFSVKWRSAEFCPITCGKNERYGTSISGCQNTCSNLHSAENCPLDNTEGCYCLPGFVLSGTSCVPDTECGCKTPEGDYYPLGTIVVSDDCTSTRQCKQKNGEAIFEVLAINERCHSNGMCGMIDGVRQCVCKDGFHGDGIKQCEPLCGGKYKCHQDANCQNGICLCKHGFYGDGLASCEETCTCTASGDPHYRLFDGQMIHFMGACKYTLSELPSEDKCSFHVEVKNVRRHENARVSFVRLVDVRVPGHVIRLHQDRKLTINKVLTFTPYVSVHNSFKVVTKGRFIVVTTSCGVVVSFDGSHSVSVTVPINFGKHLSGICGNCNKKKDDMKTRKGTDVTKMNNRYTLIGESYRVFDDLAKPGETCHASEFNVTCSDLWIKRINSNSFCGVILDKTGPFSTCIAMDPELANQFFQSCKDDVCSYENTPASAQKFSCMSVEAFAESCLTRGDTAVVWRNPGFCPLECGKHEKYNPAIVGCPASCTIPGGATECNVAPQEGCECKEGYVLSGTKCVREEECGCFYKGEYFPLGATGPLTNCDIVQTCVKDGGINIMFVKERRINCHVNAECGNKDGDFQCMCNRGYEGDGVNECSKIPPSEKPPQSDHTKVVPHIPDHVPGDKCRIVTSHETCGSVIKIYGNCHYESNFGSTCQYNIQTTTHAGKLSAAITTRGRKYNLKEGGKLQECVDIQNNGYMLYIKDDICEKCTVDFVRNIVTKNTCSASSP